MSGKKPRETARVIPRGCELEMNGASFAVRVTIYLDVCMLMRDFSGHYNFIRHCTIIMPAEFSIKIITCMHA